MVPGWLKAPTFQDPEKTRSAGVLHWILLCTAAISVAGIAATPLIYPERGTLVPFASVLVACLSSLALARRGFVRPVSMAFVGFLWLVIIWAGMRYGGPQAPAMVSLPVVIVVTGFLAGTRTAIGLGLLTTAVILAMTVGEPLPAPDLNPLQYGFSITVSVLMSVAMVALGLRSLDDALAEARASERRYAEMVEASPDGMVSLNSDGVVESVNPAAARLGGISAEEIEGRSFLDLGLVAPERLEWLVDHLPQALTGEFKGPTELDILRADGTRTSIELRVRALSRPDGSKGAQATIRDLSERRAAARELEDLQARLLQSQKLEGIGRLAGGIAHDFNNHLTAIRINGELLDRHVPDGSEGRELLAGIEMAAERSGNLIRQLLAFSRKQILRPRVIDLNELVTDLEPMLRRILPEDIALETSCQGGLWHVRADRAQVETALLNLIVNARDAMPEGGALNVQTTNVTLGGEASESVHGVAAGDFVRIEVNDSGVGIDEETRKRIFEPFFSTKGERGSGLGLSTVHGIVHQSGGSMTVESEPDRGSRFLIFLPRVDEPLEVEFETEGDTLPERSRGTILLVEDDEVVRALAISVLRARGYDIWAAPDGLEALDLVKRENPPLDLLVTDVVMPRLGGIGLARALRDSQPGLPVLFISGYVEGSGRDVLDPDSDLLHKPFTGRALALRVHTMLSRA